MIQLLILNNNATNFEKTISNFLAKGGRINDYYLKNPTRGPSLVFYKGWFRGRNVLDAIARANSLHTSEISASASNRI